MASPFRRDRTGAPEVLLISHSNLFYWWPAWVIGYIMALVTFFAGRTVDLRAVGAGPTPQIYLHSSNNPALLFICTIVLLIVFTNARLRGIYSVMTIVSVAFVAVLFAWLGWWDAILSFLPTLSARANMGFYLVFSTVLLIVWLAAFLVFDRLTYWRIRPGQLLEERLIGGSTHSLDTNGLVFELREQDLFRHTILGLGAGDLRLTTRDPRMGVIDIPNVLMASSKAQAIERLIAVKPEVVTTLQSTP